jgi:hypothetical protein
MIADIKSALTAIRQRLVRLVRRVTGRPRTPPPPPPAAPEGRQAVTLAVQAVADELASPELRRRLAEALALLPADGEPAADTPARAKDTDDDMATAMAILAVADLLTSEELQARLAGALASLPGVEVILPCEGDSFDIERHQWVSSALAPSPSAVETVAQACAAGLADRDGTVYRPARVIVYDTDTAKEQP